DAAALVEGGVRLRSGRRQAETQLVRGGTPSCRAAGAVSRSSRAVAPPCPRPSSLAGRAGRVLAGAYRAGAGFEFPSRQSRLGPAGEGVFPGRLEVKDQTASAGA